MEENTTINQPATTPVETSTTTTPVQKSNSFLISLLSILLLIAVLIAGFFAYQTQKLVKELTITKTPSTPIATQTPTADITLNWRAYTNQQLGFSFKLSTTFKYPENIVPSESNSFSNRENINSPLELAQEDLLLESTVYRNIDESSLKKVDTALSSEIGDIVGQPFQPIGSIKKLTDLENGGSIFEETPVDPNDTTYYISIWKNNGNIHVLKMFAMANIINKHKDTFIQMAETYNFVKTNDQVACTMDAKICPDGSAVGRSGPKCEFTPCPTTSPQP